jgi:hypothetical protein
MPAIMIALACAGHRRSYLRQLTPQPHDSLSQTAALAVELQGPDETESKPVQLYLTPLDRSDIATPPRARTGELAFTDVPPGRYILRVALLGFHPASDTILVLAGDRRRFRAHMKRSDYVLTEWP